jgi:hypothetical protein
MIWRGKNTNAIQCDYSNYRLCMPMPRDITDCTYADGVRVKMIRPLEEFEISFSNPAYDTSLQLHLKAVMPPAVRYNGGHFTQAMKATGTLVLRGEQFIIDGFHSRDRSWNESRGEASRITPPLNWTVGIMHENFAFHHVSFDNRKYHPEWGDRFPAHTDEGNVLWGYIWDEGVIHGVLAVDQKTTYADDGIFPVRAETILYGSNGKVYPINGRAKATTQVQCWPNMSGYFALMEWDHQGRQGYGDIQQITFGEAYRLMVAGPLTREGT